MNRYYYSASVREFLGTSDDAVLGALAKAHTQALDYEQTAAWKAEVQILKSNLTTFPNAHLFLEFVIPRMGKRADAILIIHNVVVAIEFKIGSHNYDAAAIDQAVDYALAGR